MSESRAAYEAWHERLDANVAADEPWHRLVRAHLDPDRDVTGRTVLEIGCGRGGFARWLGAAPNPPAVLLAADFAPAAIAKARESGDDRPRPTLHWAIGDVQSLAHHDGTFDTVISCETIEHVPDPAAAVAELGRVLKPGGRLFLSTPNYLGTMGLYRAYLRMRGRPYTEEGQPVNHFTTIPRTLRWVRAAGLAVRATDGCGHYFPVPGRAPVRIAALDRARGVTRWVALHSLVVAEKP